MTLTVVKTGEPMPEQWLKEIEALAAKVAPLGHIGNYALVHQSLTAAGFWMHKQVESHAPASA